MNDVQKVNAILDIFGNILTFEVTRTDGRIELLPYLQNDIFKNMVAEYIVPEVKYAKLHGKNNEILDITFNDGKTLVINESKMNEFAEESKKFIETGEIDKNPKHLTLFKYLLSSACQRYNFSPEKLRENPYISFFQGLLAEINAKSTIGGLCDLAIRVCGLERFVKRKANAFYAPNEGVPDKNGIKKVAAITDILGNTLCYQVTLFNGDIVTKNLEEGQNLLLENRITEKKPPTIKSAKYIDKEKTKLRITLEDNRALTIDCSINAYNEGCQHFQNTGNLRYNPECFDVFSYLALTLCNLYKCQPPELLKNKKLLDLLKSRTETLALKAKTMEFGDIIIKECGLERFFPKRKSNIGRIELGNTDTPKNETLKTQRKGLLGFLSKGKNTETPENKGK